MPIREFECPACGHITEKILSGVEDSQIANLDCERCGHDARRLAIATHTGLPQFVRGCGGFYSPTKG